MRFTVENIFITTEQISQELMFPLPPSPSQLNSSKSTKLVLLVF